MEDYYEIAFDIKLSRNYQSVGVQVKYGSHRLSKENLAQHEKRVNTEALRRFNKQVQIVDDFLEDIKDKK